MPPESFPAGRFAVLVVDDGSTDNTLSVLERYASGAAVRIRYHSQAQQGRAVARNLGASKALGDSLLFLCDDELVSPRLLEQHHAAREAQSKKVCTMGDIHRHPQLPHDTFTRLFLDKLPAWEDAVEPSHFLDWQRSNFCINREAFLEAGGFSTDEALSAVEIPELAFRLEAEGVRPQYLPDARVYIWQPTTFAAERYRQYLLGYGLYHLQERTGAAEIPGRFRLKKTRAEQFISTLTIPYYVRTCNRHEAETNMIIGRLYKRVLYHDRFLGYLDGLHNRPAHPPKNEEPAQPQGHSPHEIR
ncbi:MAG: glycosyltransferase family 2 protein [Candidatus Hydrogenedentes bacterium]|nr:glycosyltransferase family 2 protein [Candidatus Hydrogenedentota bacterium]